MTVERELPRSHPWPSGELCLGGRGGTGTGLCVPAHSWCVSMPMRVQGQGMPPECSVCLRQTQGCSTLSCRVMESDEPEIKPWEGHVFCKWSWPMNFPKSQCSHLTRGIIPVLQDLIQKCVHGTHSCLEGTSKDSTDVNHQSDLSLGTGPLRWDGFPQRWRATQLTF